MSNKIYLGSTNLGTGKIRLGANDVSAIYLGSSLVYGGTQPTPVAPTLVDYVHTSTASLTANYINTGIYPTTDTVFRIVFKPNTTIGNCIVGYDFTGAPGSQASTPTRASSDDTDYRLINYLGTYDFSFDFNTSRLNKQLFYDSDGYCDVTLGNNYITDNISQDNYNGLVQSNMATNNVPIYLNVSSDLDFRSLEIWQNNVKVYDGHAAVSNGTYGVYDSISGTFTTQTYGGNSMSGGTLGPDINEMLCFTSRRANLTVGMTHYGTNQTTTKPVIYYSTDNGSNWTQWDYSTITLQNVGDKVYFYGTNPNGIGSSSDNYSQFTTNGDFLGVGSLDVSGNIMSLIDQSCPNTLPQGSYCFSKLFKHTHIGSAANLLLPATTLTAYCYDNMFAECWNLNPTPTLPATALATGCYRGMFYETVYLATAPALPATSLADYCYRGMFFGCQHLIIAPELPASTLTTECYYGMFFGCSSLNSVACMATDISANNCTSNWLYGVSATGTFTKDSSMTSWTTGANGIPTGWTVETPPQVATPSIYYSDDTYGEGCPNYNGMGTITIDCATEGATIYYRKAQYDCDGTDEIQPDLSNEEWIVYDGYITESYQSNCDGTNPASFFVQAYATKSGMTDSEIAESTYSVTYDMGDCGGDEPDYCQECIDGCGGDPDCEASCYDCDSPCGEPCTDCNDCNNWAECGYGSYEDCDCAVNGNCPEEEEPVEEEPTE